MAVLRGPGLATEEAWRRVLGRQQRLWPVVMTRPSGSSVALLRKGGSSRSHSHLILTVGLPSSAFPGCPAQSPHPLDGEEGVMASRRGKLCQSSARGPGLRTCSAPSPRTRALGLPSHPRPESSPCASPPTAPVRTRGFTFPGGACVEVDKVNLSTSIVPAVRS